MDCKITEQVSRLMDGELNDDEARQVKAHLAACAICRQAQEEFLLLRRKLQAYRPEPDLAAQRQAITNILQSERTLFWRKKIALPAPAFAMLLLIFVIVSLWAIFSRNAQSPQSAVKREPATGKPPIQSQTNRFDLSKFDKGERAVIYTAKHEQPPRVER